MVRVFTKEEYGIVNMMQTYSSLFFIIASFGMLQTLGVNFNHLNSDKRKEMIVTFSIAYIILGGVIVAIAFTILSVSDFGKTIPLSIKSLSLSTSLLSFYQSLYFSVLRLKRDVMKVAFLQSGIGIFVLIANTILIGVLKSGIISIFITEFISVVFVLCLIAKRAIVEKTLTYASFNVAYIRKYWTESVHLLFSQIAVYIQVQIGRWFLLKFSGFEDVGVFSVATKFSEVINTLILAQFLNTYSPIMLKKFKDNDTNLLSVKKENFTHSMYCLLFGVVIIVIAIFLKPLFILFVGKTYENAFVPMIFIILGQFFYTATQVLSCGLIHFKKITVLTNGVWVSALLNICLSYVFIPKLGLIGAAYSNTICYVVWFLYVFIAYKKHLA